MAHRLISVFVKCIKVKDHCNIVVNSYYMAYDTTPVLFAALHFWRYVSEVFERLMYFDMYVYAGGSKAFCAGIFKTTKNRFLYHRFRCVKLAGDWPYCGHGLHIGLVYCECFGKP